MEGKVEFVVFCIENVSESLGLDSVEVYDALTRRSNILREYIVPNYECLHTQGKQYIVDDIVEVMREEGVC